MAEGFSQEALMNDLSNAETLKCEFCNNILFIQTYVLKKVSALVSSTGKDQLIPFPVFSCGDCGQIPTDMKRGILGADKNELPN